LGFALNAWLTRNIKPDDLPKPRAHLGVIWGGVAAFTSTLVQIGGPPYFVFVLPQRLPKMLFVRTTSWFFALVNLMKVAPYGGLGRFSTVGLVTSAALFPVAVARNVLGVWLVRVTPEALFFRITNVLVLVVGLELTRQGLMELSGR